MRALKLLGPLLGVVLWGLACGKAEAPDAGVPLDAGGGGEDAGFDAGLPPPVCFVDRLDAGPVDLDAGLDFSCRGLAPEWGGQAELVISGKVTRAGFTRTLTPDVRLDLLDRAGTVLATATSDDGGLYRLSFDAGCYPLDGEVRATHPNPDAGYFLSYAAPPSPWRYDRGGLELVLFDESTRGLAAALASVTLVDGGAVLALTVTDCAGRPVPGATVSTAGNVGTVRYVGASGLPTNMLSATGPSGDLVLFNLPGTTVEVSAMLDGGLIGRHTYPIHGDAASGSSLMP